MEVHECRQSQWQAAAFYWKKSILDYLFYLAGAPQINSMETATRKTSARPRLNQVRAAPPMLWLQIQFIVIRTSQNVPGSSKINAWCTQVAYASAST
jgi:hypothetical protein